LRRRRRKTSATEAGLLADFLQSRYDELAKRTVEVA
jgi:hypothetical protein